jgi:hypothetical protein
MWIWILAALNIRSSLPESVTEEDVVREGLRWEVDGTGSGL